MSFYRVDLYRDDRRWKSLYIEAESKRKALLNACVKEPRDIAIAHYHSIDEISKHEYMEVI